MQRTETTMDDVAEVVGYTNARNLQAWWCDKQLYVPHEAYSTHPLAVLLSMPLLRALVKRFGGQQLKIPSDAADQRARRERLIAERLADGAGVGEIGQEFGLTPRRVEQMRSELVLRGWMALAEGSKAARAAKARGRYRLLEPEILGTGEVPDGTPPPAQS